MSYYPTEQEKKKGDLAWQMWWSRINACIRYRQGCSYGDTQWERYYNTYKGLQWDDIEELYDINSDNLPDRITVNITASTILNIVPFLINEKAQYKLEPRKPDDVVNAMLKEKVLNYEFKHRNIQDQLRKVVYDNVIIGHGIAKTGFVRTIDEAASKAVGDIEYDDMIEDESVYARRINPFNFWMDYSAIDKNLETARYTVERYYKYAPDLIENTSYSASVREKIEDGTYSLTTTKSNPNYVGMQNDLAWLNDTYDDYESEMAVLYEVWDKKYNQVLTFVCGVVEPIRIIDNPYPYLRGEFPYIKTDYIYIPNEFYGYGVPKFIEQQQFELNRHRTFAYNHRRRFSARKYQVTEDVDPEELEKLQDAEDGTYIVVPSIGNIAAIEDVALPRDYPLIEALIKGDINEQSGTDSLSRGNNLQSRATLGEVQTRTNIMSLKLNEKVAGVDALFLKTGSQMQSHIGANYVKSLIVRLVGPQGEFWVEVNNEDLKDEMDVTMMTVSAPRRNPELELQQRIQMFQMSMQLLPLIQGGLIPADAINFVELFKWTLEGFERQDIGRFFQPALSPVNPLSQVTIAAQQVPQQFSQQTNNPQDLLRGIAAGNPAGLQAAGGV